jgi:hypothetical protein
MTLDTKDAIPHSVIPEIEQEALEEYAATLRDRLYEEAIRNGSDLTELDKSWKQIVKAQKEEELDPIKEKDPHEYRLIVEILRAKGDLRKTLNIEGEALEEIFESAYQNARNIIKKGDFNNLYNDVAEKAKTLTINVGNSTRNLPDSAQGIFKYLTLGIIELHTYNSSKTRHLANNTILG